MKEKVIIILSAIVMILGVSAVFYKIYNHKEVENTEALKFKEDYESLNGKTNEANNKEYRTVEISKDNSFIYKNAEEVADMIESKKSFVVYFGYNSCPWCRSVISTLDKAASDLDLKEIYYVDIHDIRDTLKLNDGKAETVKEGSKGYMRLLDLLDNVLEDYTLTNDKGKEIITGEKRIYAPNVAVIIDGEAQKLTTGISSKQNDAYMELTEEMQTETYNDFKEIINIYKDNDCESSNVC